MKWFLFVLLCFFASGCLTRSTHTKKADENRLDLATVLEEYVYLDADTPIKQAVLNDITDIKREAEKIAKDDPSFFKPIDQGMNSLNAVTGGAGLLGVVSLGWTILRGRKFKQIIERLCEEPDADKCRSIAAGRA